MLDDSGTNMAGDPAGWLCSHTKRYTHSQQCMLTEKALRVRDRRAQKPAQAGHACAPTHPSSGAHAPLRSLSRLYLARLLLLEVLEVLKVQLIQDL